MMRRLNKMGGSRGSKKLNKVKGEDAESVDCDT